MSRAGSAQPAVPDHLGGDAGDSGLARHRMSTTEPAATREQSADLDIAEYLRAGGDHHASPHLGMAIAALLAGAAQRHALQNRDVVVDDRRRADDEFGRMIEEYAAAEAGRRMNIGLEGVGGAALQIEREIRLAVAPQPMRQPMGLEGVEALEEQQRLDQPAAGARRARRPP